MLAKLPSGNCERTYIDFKFGTNTKEFQPVLRNVGATPTKRAVVCVNFYIDETPIGDNFDFPDVGSPSPTTLAAGQELAFQGPTISSIDMDHVRNGTAHFYVYGWVEYDDVFVHTPRRRTEFCSKFLVGLGNWSLISHSTFNGSDEECVHRPRT